MENLFRKVTKSVVLFLCVCLGGSAAFAQTLTVDGVESAAVCPREPIVLSTTKFPEGSKAADLLVSTDGGNSWVSKQTSSDPSRSYTFVWDMGSSEILFKVRSQGLNPAVETNVVTVTVETDCAKACHQSSSGEYINGTDFTPKSPNYSNSHSLGKLNNNNMNQIENYFPEQDITLKTSECIGEVSNDFGDFFGNLKPKNDEGNFSNYYWFSDPNSDVGNCTPFHYDFLLLDGKSNAVWDDKYYRMTLKSYIRLKEGCNLGNCSEAKVKLECSQGSHGNFYQNADHADIFIIDDVSGDTLGIKSINKSFDQIKVGDLFCKSTYQKKLLRMEIHFYGRFDAMNKNANTVFEMKPLFQQFGCVQMAIDYISADVMSVCMDNGAACIGESVTVNAAGFPYGADYVWEVENNNGGWDRLIVNGYDVSKLNYQTVNIPVEKLGKRRYRVGDAKTIATKESDYLYFNVTGKDCEPTQPTDIKVPDKLCAPVDDYEFSVSPVDANPLVRYSWTLIDAVGKDITKTNLKFDGRGDVVKVSLNSDNARGKYTIKVQPITVRNSSDGSTYEEPAGKEIDTTFMVYQSPVVTLSLNGFGPNVSESEKKLCPNDDEQGITAVIDPKYNYYEYVYEWFNATAQVSGGNVADVTLPRDSACAGLITDRTISAIVSIKDVGCPTRVGEKYDLDKLVEPEIDCGVLNDKEFVLGPKDVYYTLELPMPEFSAGCDSNPDIKVVVTTNPLDKKISSTTTNFLVAKNKWNEEVKSVKISAGTATITYSVIDACNKTASCTATVTIKDVTKPNLACENIPSHRTYTEDQGGCFGNPGLHDSLPTLTPPILTDLNGVDGDIEGKYIGRYYNPESSDVPSAEPEKFDSLVLLNNPYQVGTSYNLWEFKDASKNVVYCLQKIEVIDNTKPDVTCTSPLVGNIPTEKGVCGLSFNGYQAFLQEGQKPSAKDVCTNVGVQIEAEMFYKKKTDTDTIPIPKSDFDKLIFDKGETYHLIWRFYKFNRKNYDDCVQEFTVVDVDAPSFVCDSLTDVIVTANYVGVSTGQSYKEYASYSDDDELNGYKYVPTLKTEINSGVIRIPSLEEYKDNCDENPTIKITLVGPGPSNQGPGPVRPGSPETPQIITKKITSIDDLKEHKFYEGLTTLTFVFTDADGNSITCQQNITVVSDETPATSCPTSSNVTLKSDDNCEAILNFALDKVPTALVTYVPNGLYFNFRQKFAERNNIYSMEDALKFFPNNLTSLKYTTGYDRYEWNPMGGTTTHYELVYKAKNTFDISVFCDPNFDRNLPENQFTNYLELESCTPPAPMGPAGNFVHEQLTNSLTGDENRILSTSNSLSTPIVLTVYPYKAILRDSLGNEVATVVNTYEDVDKSPLSRLVPRVFVNGGNDTSQVHAHVCKYKYSKITNFKNLDEFAAHPLKEGNYTITWYFENHKDVEGKKESECTSFVTVLDTIAPTLICGDWQKEGTFAANDECKLPTSEVPWFTKPTVEQLGVSDNCTTELDEFTLSWERVSNNWISTSTDALTEPFPIGTTTMTWIVADKSGNKSTCVQSIIIEDQTAPKVDCSMLPLITAYTTPTACEASSNAVIEAGLSVPTVDNDPCSPVGSATDKIKGTGVRDDGKDIFGYPYRLGQTIITWTFTDGAGNSVSCEQIVNVLDTISPTFPDCENLKDLVYKLASSECDATLENVRLLLGTHQAIDVCDPNPIVGVPYLDNNGTLSDLPTLFERNKFYTIAWVFEDKSGNRTICYQSLEIRDVTPPIADGICPDPTKSVEAQTECSVSFADLQLPLPTLSDPCDGVLIPQLVGKITMNDGRVNVYYDEQLESIEYPVGVHQFLWIYSDAAGNKDTCIMDLTVVDKIKPVLEDCETSPNITVTVSDEFCEITPKELDKLLVHPKAYDECDDLKGEGGKHYIDPTILRFYDKNKNGVYEADELVLDADGFPIVWNSVNFPKGTTMLRWIFVDNSGNKDSCEKTITVEDHTPPFFDCSKIDPDTLRPEAPTCTYEFADLKRDLLDHLSYNAYDACTKDSIPGFLTTDGINPIPDSYTLQAGVIYKLLWVFADKDGNRTTCNQWILPSHQLPLNINCNEILDQTISILAEEGTCSASNSEILDSVKIPSTLDPCGLGTVYGVPFDSTGLAEMDLATYEFKTGNTTIRWRFVSPWNLNDTAWCEQNIVVKGNKKFEFLCDTLTPTYHDTIVGCGPVDPALLNIPTPAVPDPCLEEVHPEYLRQGVPTRLDGKAFTDPFPLGNTQIKWTFTDFTGAIDTFCIQDIEIRSSEGLIVKCEEIEDVHVEVEEGECTVDANKVKLPTPQFALHPCLKDANGEPLKIEGVPTRGDKKDLDSSYYVGRTLIIWTFTDTTNTLAQPIDTCHSYVQVGDINEMPVDCKNFPDTVLILDDDQCELSWADFNFEVKPVVDLCTREIIDPVVFVSSSKEVIEQLEYKTYFILENGEEVVELAPMQEAKDTVVRLLNNLTLSLGAATITWQYDFKGTIFSCDQRISVKNKVAPSGGCESVPNELTIVAPTGKCEIPASALVDSLLKILDPWPVAYDHCDEGKSNPIKGKIYFEGKEITETGTFTLPVGKNTVQWVFIDTAINIVGDTCEKTIVIQSDIAPIFDCKSLDTLDFETPDCEFVYNWTDDNTPKAEDACTKELFAGVGLRSDAKSLNEPYPVGKTSIKWIFKSPYSTDSVVCDQIVWVRTSAEPLFDCSSLDTIRLEVADGVCDADAFTNMVLNGIPVAKDSCTGIEIPGIPLTRDSIAYAETAKFYVGDTTKIIWKFFHDSLNVNPKYCDQYVLVTSYNEPIFNCDSLKEDDIKFEIAGCDTLLGSDAIPTPVALDYCTKDSVYGVGSRSDGKALDEPFPVGTTTITWLFKSPYSEVSIDCPQDVVVLSTQEIDFDCDNLDSIYVPVDDVNTCDIFDYVLKAPVALHPCPKQSSITEIVGVPFINSAVNIVPNLDSTEWTIEKIHVGIHKITWTFTDPSNPATLVDPDKECTQILQIGDGTNASIDCDNYPDTTILLNPEDCAISWEDMNLNFSPVYDVCSGELLIPTLSRSSGKAIEALMNPDSTLMIVADDFTVGVDTIFWLFERIGAQCEQAILVKDSMAPEFDCDNFEPNHLALSAPSGECEVVASAIYDSLVNLLTPWPTAIEKCTGDSIAGRVYLDEISDGNEIKSNTSLKVTVGDHKLIWLFIDSLINEVGAICEKEFTLKSDMAPTFDCESLQDLEFNIEGCNSNELSDADIPTPQAKDACVDTLISGVGVRLNPDSTIQMNGTEPLSVLGVYPVGTTLIRWTFTSPFSDEEKVCYQNVVVKTTQEIDFDCETLAGDIIRISVNPLTLVSDPEAETSRIDTLHALHPCPTESGVDFIFGVPSIAGKDDFILTEDSLKWTIPALPADTYTIVWTFVDTTKTMVEPVKKCEQTLIVENLKDTLFCPDGRNHSTITCVTEESLPVYKSFEEFKEAGGWITDHNQFDASSFGHFEDSIGVPYCDQTRYVTYFVLDVRGDKISCTDTIYVKDNVAPDFVDMPKDMTIACDQELPIFDDVVVEDCDPNATVTLDFVSHQSSNPSECDYYSYKVDYTWTAVDRCKNSSKYDLVVNVVDTIAPKINLPLDWADTALSSYLKGCLFSVPDFEDDLRSEEVIQDNCSSLDNIKITQYPAAGDTIMETTTIYITISDPCGKDTVVTKVVYVQKQAEILSLDAYDITKCGSDSSVIDLWGQNTRFATGYRYRDYKGTWYKVPSNPVYDCYRDSISEKTLVFSDNPLTYYDRYHPGPSEKDKEIQRSLTELRRMSRSGKYIFVATDTSTMCSDTASAYLTINERPRVSIQSGIMTICELTTVDSVELYSYVKCVDDMGSEITNEGWFLGDDIYSFMDSVILANNEDNFVYVVENACGKTTSEDTYITFCDSIPVTTEDSLKWVGGSEKNLALLRSEDYKTKDSIMMDVRKRFDSQAISINSQPSDPARIWKGEQVVLELNTEYKFEMCYWYKVDGYFDYSSAVVKDSVTDEEDDILDVMFYSELTQLFEYPEDTTTYYVTLTDGVCPPIPSQLLQVDVLPKLPTAFTPYDKDGLNDVYMEGRSVVIFDRYGAKVFEGDNGWDGTFKGRLADPGVYFSRVILKNGMSLSGTIEIVKVK